MQETKLRKRLEELEKDSEQHQAVVNGLTTKYMETIERMQSDKARLEVRITECEGAGIFILNMCFKDVFKMFAFLLTGENTDSGEGSKRVQTANRRVVYLL